MGEIVRPFKELPMVQLELDLWIEPTPEEQEEANRVGAYWNAIKRADPMPIQRPDPEMRVIIHLMANSQENAQITSVVQPLLIFEAKQSKTDL